MQKPPRKKDLQSRPESRTLAKPKRPQPMIKRYSDHAANERTYLAWLRTAIAIIAFGFLIERFDLFLHYLAKAVDDKMHLTVVQGGKELGLILVAIGCMVISVATWRFLITRKRIQTDEDMTFHTGSSIALGMMLLLIGLFVLAYVTRLILTT